MKKYSRNAVYKIEFALGVAYVRLLGWKYKYSDGLVFHVEDISTGHRDFVGYEYISPAITGAKPPHEKYS